MDIKLLKQTRNMNCGQTAVAMLTGRSIAAIEAVYGHGHVTFSHEHIKAVTSLGFYADERGFVKHTGTMPELALVRIKYLKKSGGSYSTSGKTKRTGHLVLWANGRFYDPRGTEYTQMEKGAIIDTVLEVLAP